MADEDVHHLLGKLEAGIENIAEAQRLFRIEQRADNKLIFNRLENISINGCAIGKRNSDDIKKLQEQPAKAVSLGAAIASVIAMISSVILAWRGH